MESVKTILQCQTKKFQRPGYEPFSASVDLTKRHYLLLRKARELVKSNDDIDLLLRTLIAPLGLDIKMVHIGASIVKTVIKSLSPH